MKKLLWSVHTENRAAGRPGYPMVEIIWEDAQAIATEDWVEEFDGNAALTTTVGYLVGKTRSTVTVVSMINSNHIGHGITIPKGCILGKIRFLSVEG